MFFKWYYNSKIHKIPAISTTQGLPTEYTPLLFIIFVTALKDMYEDYQRHKNDNRENNKMVAKGEMKSNFKSTFGASEIIRNSNSGIIFFDSKKDSRLKVA